MALGLGLLFLGKYESTEAVLETIKAIEHPISSVVDVLVTICSYAGTGNVLQIQKLLHNCTAKVEADDADDNSAAESEPVKDPTLLPARLKPSPPALLLLRLLRATSPAPKSHCLKARCRPFPFWASPQLPWVKTLARRWCSVTLAT